VLTVSTMTAVRLMGVRPVHQPAVSLEKIKVLIQQGTEEGVFEETEQELVTNVLNLDDRTVAEILTPRTDVVYLDTGQSFERNRDTLNQTPHSVVPLCEGGVEHVIGFLRSTDLLKRLLAGQPMEWSSLVAPPLFVPCTITLMRLLQQFRRTHLPVALVVDEFGDVDGLVSLTDVMTAIVGELALERGEEPLIVRRKDGSWPMEGMVDIDVLGRELGSDAFGEGNDDHTLAGLSMSELGRIPKAGDASNGEGSGSRSWIWMVTALTAYWSLGGVRNSPARVPRPDQDSVQPKSHAGKDGSGRPPWSHAGRAPMGITLRVAAFRPRPGDRRRVLFGCTS